MSKSKKKKQNKQYEIYCDGSHNERTDEYGIGYVIVTPNGSKYSYREKLSGEQTTETAEIYSVAYSILRLPKKVDVTIYNDLLPIKKYLNKGKAGIMDWLASSLEDQNYNRAYALVTLLKNYAQIGNIKVVHLSKTMGENILLADEEARYACGNAKRMKPKSTGKSMYMKAFRKSSSGRGSRHNVDEQWIVESIRAFGLD